MKTFLWIAVVLGLFSGCASIPERSASPERDIQGSFRLTETSRKRCVRFGFRIDALPVIVFENGHFVGKGIPSCLFGWKEKGPVDTCGTYTIRYGYSVGLVFDDPLQCGLISTSGGLSIERRRGGIVLRWIGSDMKTEGPLEFEKIGQANQRSEGTPGKPSPSKPSQVPGVPHP